MRTFISGGTLVTPDETLLEHTLVIEDSCISTIEARRGWVAGPGERLIDAQGLWVIAGLIDVHVHGSAGYDVMDATPEALQGLGRFLARHGVTAYLPTTLAASDDAVWAAIENVARCPQPADGAQHLGVHLEGPYLSCEHRGAQPAPHLRDPDPAEYTAWLDSGSVRLITVAPELPGALALIDEGVKRGIEFAVGHSGASYERVLEAVAHGLRQATHTFNGMLGLHHRAPGTSGAVLADERIYAQVIADGIHLHPAVVKILVRAKGTGRTILISDAVRVAGLADGDYDLAGQTIRVRDGVARTLVGGLAGSSLTLDVALRNVMSFAGLSLAEAVPMATSVAAEAMGLAAHKGRLAPGLDADVVLLDASLDVRLTMVAGEVVYRNPA